MRETKAVYCNAIMPKGGGTQHCFPLSRGMALSLIADCHMKLIGVINPENGNSSLEQER
jgi:hypothetical protein